MNRTHIVGIGATVLFTLACSGTVQTEPSGSTGGTSGSGGATSGGSSTGGAATGGTGDAGAAGSTGGSSAYGGTGGTGATGGVGAWPLCEEPGSECKIFSDCCTCTAYGPTEPPPPSCAMDCDQDACSASGVAQGQTPVCSLGQCIVGMDCDPTHAMCNALPPDCAPGMSPTVVDGCWGGCIDSTECLTVYDCAACASPGQLCVHQQNTESVYRCVETPPPCGYNPSEDCLCSVLCPSWNFCSLQSDRLQCDYI